MIEYVALIGSPNSGKSTLFNWLTGRNQKVVNYPGSTVDLSVGEILPNLWPSGQQREIRLLDTPGTYSLFAKSPEEEVTKRALFDPKYNIQKVILVLDSTQLARQYHLIRQLKESKFDVLIAVTMYDLHRNENGEVRLDILAKKVGLPALAIDGVLGGGTKELVNELTLWQPQGHLPIQPQPWELQKWRDVAAEGERVASEVTSRKLEVFQKSESKDRFLLHPIFGPVLFVAVMTALFSSIYWLASPVMDQVEGLFSWLSELTKSLAGEGLVGQLLSDGIVAGLGAVMVFVPQIFILFFGISLLEDSGYLARAATLIDRPLSWLGLSGKSFVPLLSGFACAVPAMMAARTVNSTKEKWIVMFIIPFMTCSARLPVYALLIGFVFMDRSFYGGLAMAGMYFGAIITGAIAAKTLSKMIPIKSAGYFLMELPLYRRPKLQNVLRNSTRRTNAYIKKTGPIILVLSILIWGFSTFPNYSEENSGTRLETSYIGMVGQKIEPIFKPMGVDWRVGIGLMTAFAAREVFVSSLAVMFNMSDEGEDEEGFQTGLIDKMRLAKFSDGTPIFTLASVASLLVFFMIALQCLSTTATARQETGSARFAWIQLISMNVLAYILAVATYQMLA